MRKLLTCFFMVGFSALPAIADQGPTISRALPSSISQTQTAPATTDFNGSVAPSRATISRGVVASSSVGTSTTSRSDAGDIDTDTAPNRAAVTRNVANAIDATGRGTSSATPSRGGVSRSVTASTTSARNALESAANNVGRDVRTKTTGINSTAAARRAGVTLRPTTAEVGGRAVIGNTDIQTGSNIGNEARNVQNRAAVSQRPTAETIAEATERLQQTASLNKSCQEQYNDCMDQFCAVIDANQKRCSCSANLSRYAKVEEAVKDANAQLNEVAQRIRYVGLSADEIRAIMSATEAEDVLSGTRDTTESRSMLDEIEKLIRSPTSSSSYSADTYSGLDMNLDFTGESNDLFNLDFLGTSSSSFSNLRGTELYNAAKKRCKSVLTQCKTAGATEQQITGNYDLAIDKDCIAYEQGLAKMNESLKNNVRSANQMLQKARLAVLQNKNQYDTKGCISALNTCMVDDMVCGADYTKCLDPTKKYIDENGKVVLGQRISDILAFMKQYNNAEINSEFLKTAVNADMASCATTNNDGKCIVKYLMQKIGTGKTVNEGGLCRAVLDKCQRVTYNSANNAYDPYNEVVVNYIQRAMVNIQAAQSKIISDYASTCMVDIATCYNQQVSQVNSWSTSANTDSIYNVMRGACRNVSLTCAYAVFASDTESCPVGNELADQAKCIDSVSKIFYQSLLCPENSTYQTTSGTPGDGGYVNDRCKCNTGYFVVGRTCSLPCKPGTYRDSLSGYCTSCPAGTYSNSENATQCQDCQSGYYCPSGAASMTQCPDDKPDSNAKSTNVSQCYKKPATT